LKNSRLEGLSSLYKKSYEKIENEEEGNTEKSKVVMVKLYLENVNKKIEKVIKD
jgi:hypothetical protein